MITEKGTAKKVSLGSFTNVRRSGLIAIKLKKDDILKWVRPTTGKNEIVLVSSKGQAIRFKEKDLRSMGRNATGVRGIRLKKDDLVVGMGVIYQRENKDKNTKLLIITEKGFGKMTFLSNYRLQGRGGSGVNTAKITDKNGKIIGVRIIDEKSLPDYIKGDLLIISRLGQTIRLPLKSVPVMGRSTQGVHLMRFKKEDDQVSSLTLI